MKLSKAEEQLVLAVRAMGGVTSIEELEEKVKKLGDEFDELRRYKDFMDNHPTHEIEIKSYSEGKGSSFKTQLPKGQMQQIVKYLMERNLEAQATANEQLQKAKRGY